MKSDVKDLKLNRMGRDRVEWAYQDMPVLQEINKDLSRRKPFKDINVSIPNDSKSVFIAWSIFHSFQYFIPIGLFILGFVVWFRRRKA